MSQRAPIRAGTVLLRVTRPMTAPSFMRRKIQSPNVGIRNSALSYRIFLVHQADDHPTDRAFFVAHSVPRGRTVRGNDHPLVEGGAVGIDRDLWRALGIARHTDGLANEERPALQAGVFAGGYDVAFNSG